MFTGLVDAVGVIGDARDTAGGRELTVECDYPDVIVGESIAVDGACLTVTGRMGGSFAVHVIRTSLDRTNFGEYVAGRRVNLERALRVGDRLGGHIVQGHVDGAGIIVRIATADDARLLDIQVPDEVSQVSIPLGSVTIDGVSLTINAIPGVGVIQVSLIPFTLQHTTLGERQRGDRVHLEGDVVGKHVRQASGAWRQ